MLIYFLVPEDVGNKIEHRYIVHCHEELGLGEDSYHTKYHTPSNIQMMLSQRWTENLFQYFSTNGEPEMERTTDY